MPEQPDDESPFRRVVFPPWPDSGIIPGATADDVIGLTLTAPILAGLESQELATQARAAEEHVWMHGLPAAPRNAFGQLADFAGPLSASLLVATKMSYYLSISPEILDDYQWTDPIPGMMRVALGTATPEEIAANEERRARYLAEQQVKNTEAIAEWTALCEQHAGSPAIVAVLDIHRPTEDGGMIECQHPVFGYEADAEDWPCETYLAVRNAP